MSDLVGVAIVGASVAGLHAAEQLRSLGYAGSVTIVGPERHVPYDRPPLSKGVLLGNADLADIRLHSEARIAEMALDVRLGVTATGLRGTTVVLDCGEELPAEYVIIATGLTARRLPGQPDCDSVLTLRGFDDALRIEARLSTSRSIAILGAGLIGGEVASAARQRGLSVTLIEALNSPMSQSLGPIAGQILADIYEEAGVELRTGTTARAFEADDRSVALQLSDSSLISAETVLVAVGGDPATRWLDAGPSADAHGALCCDAYGRVRGRERVFAIGDVAAWPDGAGGLYRPGHWASARSKAAIVAQTITGAGALIPAVPDYAWTDQFGLRIQIVGRPELADETTLIQSGDSSPAGTIVGYFHCGRMVAAVLMGTPRDLGRYSRMVSEGEPLAEFTLAGRPQPMQRRVTLA